MNQRLIQLHAFIQRLEAQGCWLLAEWGRQVLAEEIRKTKGGV